MNTFFILSMSISAFTAFNHCSASSIGHLIEYSHSVRNVGVYFDMIVCHNPKQAGLAATSSTAINYGLTRNPSILRIYRTQRRLFSHYDFFT